LIYLYYLNVKKECPKETSRSIISLIFTRKKFHLVLAWLLSETHGAAWQHCTVVDFNGFSSDEFTKVATVNPPDEKVVKSDSVH
jgi:hypothetical protein